jgi:putative spermidine/putrescine transport system substrate-binding protein
MRMTLTRRTALAAGAAGAGAWLAPAAPARAQRTSRVVVGTWGGDYQDLLEINVERRLLAPIDIAVEYDVANAPQRKARLVAERESRHGSFDVACLSDIDMYEMAQLDLFEPVAVDNVPNLANLAAPFASPYAIPHIHSIRVILYNPEKIPGGMVSYHDIWDPKYRSRIGFADGLYLQVIESAALIAGGAMNDFEPGKRKLMELKGHATVFPSNEALADSLRAGETWATIMWLARGFMWRKAGIGVTHAVPEEGATPIVFEAAVPKNAENKANGFKYLDAMLDARGQAGFAERMGYAPTVTNAALPPELAAQIALTPDQQARLNIPDHAYLAANNAQLLEFWNREFKG